MNGRYLLDTNAVIALFENETKLLERLATASETFVPTIALGELYFGAAKSRQATQNTARIDEFGARSSVLGCDASVAREYGRIKNRLGEKGRPLPENDL
jgi:tRNA(fMet)-specific endonuclease VapC